MDFYLAMKDAGGRMYWNEANSACQRYKFCNQYGRLPTYDEFLKVKYNKYAVNEMLTKNGGTKLSDIEYTTSTYGGRDDNGDWYYDVEIADYATWHHNYVLYNDSNVRAVISAN